MFYIVQTRIKTISLSFVQQIYDTSVLVSSKIRLVYCINPSSYNLCLCGFHSVSIHHQVNMPRIQSEEYFLSQVLPKDWKVIRARHGYNEITLMISPDGKKFDTLEKANDYMEEQKTKKTSIKGEMFRRLFEAEDTPLAISESARYRRKYMARKNPFRNLRQRTLEKNHVQHASQGETTIKYQKYLAKKKKEVRKSKEMSAQENTNNTQNVNIIILDVDRETHYRVKRTTLIKQLRKSYSERVGVPMKSVKFYYKGQRIHNDDTAYALEMDEYAVIKVNKKQSSTHLRDLKRDKTSERKRELKKSKGL